MHTYIWFYLQLKPMQRPTQSNDQPSVMTILSPSQICPTFCDTWSADQPITLPPFAQLHSWLHRQVLIVIVVRSSKCHINIISQ